MYSDSIGISTNFFVFNSLCTPQQFPVTGKRISQWTGQVFLYYLPGLGCILLVTTDFILLTYLFRLQIVSQFLG